MLLHNCKGVVPDAHSVGWHTGSIGSCFRSSQRRLRTPKLPALLSLAAVASQAPYTASINQRPESIRVSNLRRRHGRKQTAMKMVALMLSTTSLSATSPQGSAMPVLLIPFERLENGPWRVRHWTERPFIFLSYAGDWSRGYQRAAHECRVQGLLTPTWEDPTFPHPIESSATEWGWSLRPEGKTRRECYEWVKKVYLEKIRKRAHSNVPLKEGERFYSLTGHSWFSVYGAQWGCDMIGLETGENIIAMQGEMAFLRGAARQNAKPFYVQPSQWYGGTVPLFREGEDEFTPHELDEAKVWEGIRSGGIAIPNGGHSSSLLSRMWYIAWLSGAAVVCPEACQTNFFAATEVEGQPRERRIPLSPYGKRAQAFVQVTERHPDIGIPYMPFALVLDEYCGFNGFPLTQPRPWNVLEPALGDREISLFLDALFPKSMYLDFMPGVDVEQEDRRLVPSPYGDSFDVLLSNVSLQVLKTYPVAIALGDHEFLPGTLDKLVLYLRGGGRLFLTHSQAEQLGARFKALRDAGAVELFGLDRQHMPEQVDIARWYTPAHWGADAATLAARKKGVELLPYEQHFMAEVSRIMSRLAAQYVPVRVSGSVEFLVNRTKRGWIVGLVNNQGVTKDNMHSVRVDPSKEESVTVALKSGRLRTAEEWCGEGRLVPKRNVVRVAVPPGEVRIVELTVAG